MQHRVELFIIDDIERFVIRKGRNRCALSMCSF